MKDGLKVAVIGATGAVGGELLSILEKRRFPVNELVPFASKRSEGKLLNWSGKTYSCQTLQRGCFDGVQIAFFDASDAISKEWVPHAVESGAWVVDNSATFRYEDDIPLIVPEVNGSLLEKIFQMKKGLSARQKILSGPNCVTVPLTVVLKPIHERWGIKRVVVSTYQSTSGAGAAAMEELKNQTQSFLQNQKMESQIFPHQIAFNCIPHIGSFKSDGSTGEEQKVIAETRKILNLPSLKISVTSVRVPTLSCHGESVNIECERPFSIQEVQSALANQAGIILQDDPQGFIYPLGVTTLGDRVEGASGRDAVYVGRVRVDSSLDHGINLWLVSDNLRKGAALNAVQMGELLLKSALAK